MASKSSYSYVNLADESERGRCNISIILPSNRSDPFSVAQKTTHRPFNVSLHPFSLERGSSPSLHSNSNKVQWRISTLCPLKNAKGRSSIHRRGERMAKREDDRTKEAGDKERMGRRGGVAGSLEEACWYRSTLVIGVSALSLVFLQPILHLARQTHPPDSRQQ